MVITDKFNVGIVLMLCRNIVIFRYKGYDATSKSDDDDIVIGELTDEDIALFYDEERQFQRAHHQYHNDPEAFLTEIYNIAWTSISAMALGSVTVDNLACKLFDEPPHGEASISAITAGKPNGVSADRLAKLFSISHDDAAWTLSVMTQLNRQAADSSLSRNFGTNDRMLHYKRIKSTFFTDTMYVTAKAKSTRGNTCAQIYVSDKAFLAAYPMRDTKSYINSLKQFAKDVGAPETLVCDAHPTQKKRDVRDFLMQIGTTLRVLEANTQWANRAELYIGLLKEAIRKDMRETNSPLVLWDYCLERRALIFQVTAKKLFQLNGTNPHTATFGTEADISHLCQFSWCEWVYYWDQSASFPYPKECLGEEEHYCDDNLYILDYEHGARDYSRMMLVIAVSDCDRWHGPVDGQTWLWRDDRWPCLAT